MSTLLIMLINVQKIKEDYMSTLSRFPITEIGEKNKTCFTRVRTTIETAFLGNNVHEVKSLKEAYELAKAASGVIVSDLPVINAQELDLPADAKVLIFNDGKITGRQARLRKLVTDETRMGYADTVREVVFKGRGKKFLSATAYVGLDEDFMVRAHLMVPVEYANTLYSWLLNFQIADEKYGKIYAKSRQIKEGDIYIYSDPDTLPADYPNGLALFDDTYNCACILGMRYFGEHKKGTLTLAWSIAGRECYTACHGGQKRYKFKDGVEKVISVFGLSGSGKSTITLAEPTDGSKVTVLHDDAFIISNKNGSSVRLEQSYFDKTSDYPLTRDQSKYFLTIQNCGATIDEAGRIVPVTEDVYAVNGRTIKSRFAAENSEYKFTHPTDAIIWIMKDPTLPPVIKVNSTILASAMGATLATKRSSAEYIPGVDINKLIIVPYANPFRLYKLEEDFFKFKDLFDKGIACYVLNTGDFLGKKITKEITLDIVERIAKEEIEFDAFGDIKELQYAKIDGFIPDFNNKEYNTQLKERFTDRLHFVNEQEGNEALPKEASEAFASIISQIK